MESTILNLLALFEAWDKDGDGRITREEFADAIIAIGITEVRDEALAAFDCFDADNSGELTLTELKIQIDIGRQAFGANGAIGANGLESTMSFASKEMGTLSTCEKLGHAFIIVSILLLPLFGIYINLGVDLSELINGTDQFFMCRHRECLCVAGNHEWLQNGDATGVYACPRCLTRY